MDNPPVDRLKTEIKQLIIDALKIPDVNPADIKDDTPLFEEGNAFKLDSLDSLEIIMALQKRYGVHFDDKNVSKFILKSIDSITDFIRKELSSGSDGSADGKADDDPSKPRR